MRRAVVRASALLAGSVLFLGSLACESAEAPSLRVGSKQFTESVVLAELAAGVARATGAQVEHRAALGGTRVLWRALERGEIDLYPEYTGTLTREILRIRADDSSALTRELADRGVSLGQALGFDNRYAIGMRRERARALGITRLSELARHPALRFGMTAEFMGRADGWPLLSERYQLATVQVRELDHDLAYRGLVSGAVDVTDLYTTDAEILEHELALLIDDRAVFPEYQAHYVMRARWAREHPELVRQLGRLAGTLDADTMRQLNARVKFGYQSELEVAQLWLSERLGIAVPSTPHLTSWWRPVREHLVLVLSSLMAAIAVALPLGVLSARYRACGQLVLGAVATLQTLPSLALLVFMIPLLGIGAAPAIAALFLYSLLPIVRNTYTGLTGIEPGLREAGLMLGLGARTRLFKVELPLASRAILSGIKTAAVLNVGTATLGALIGAGGLGEPILRGIRLDDYGLILSGAIPAALLALAVQGAFELAERFLVPRGLRLT
ncbi:MAG: glycine betaine ABC transporter substrate-binding protein [Myxococcales bacterium]